MQSCRVATNGLCTYNDPAAKVDSNASSHREATFIITQVYLYNLLQVGNAAWKEFLKTVLGFTSNQLNTILIVAYVLLYLGILAYKYYFIRWSWRSVYVVTTLLNGVFSALQILL